MDNGLWPVICLEGMPPELAVKNDGKNWQNPHPPKGPPEYLKWQHICHEVVRHCRAKWGDAIHNWYFEVWNEPDARSYFSGTLEEYLKVYDHAVAGATSADPAIRIGGPASAGAEWCRPLLEHCASGHNDATGGRSCRVDFLSWHIYTVGAGIPVFDVLRMDCEAVRQAINAVPQCKDIPTIITEWGGASSHHPVHDRPFDAAFRTMAVRCFSITTSRWRSRFASVKDRLMRMKDFKAALPCLPKRRFPSPAFARSNCCAA